MSMDEFQKQISLCTQSDEEVINFIEDFAMVRLESIARGVIDEARERFEQQGNIEPDWSDEATLKKSGIDSSWISSVAQPEEIYFHVDLLTTNKWPIVETYLEKTFLSEKQKKSLFPRLSKKTAPKDAGEMLIPEVQRLNKFLHNARTSGLTLEDFRRYKHAVTIHGRSQNLNGRVGHIGAAIAFMDAIRENAPDAIVDVFGDEIPATVSSPKEVYAYLEEGKGGPKTILLSNHRAISFASDPDIAIFQSLESPFMSAKQAHNEWNRVRKKVTKRRNLVHIFCAGEVKTATDINNLHERLALGSRETRDEVRHDRFLMMAAITKDIFDNSKNEKRRKGGGLTNKDVSRFSDIFNLYFAWGYEGVREKHQEHWWMFKKKISDWCGL